MKVLLLGLHDLAKSVVEAGLKVASDPADAAVCVTDARHAEFAPPGIPLLVIGTGSVSDWAVCTLRPDAKIVRKEDVVAELLALSPAPPPDRGESGGPPGVPGAADTPSGVPAGSGATGEGALDLSGHGGRAPLVVVCGMEGPRGGMRVVACPTLAEFRKWLKVHGGGADIILVGSDFRDAEKCVRAARRAGLTVPIVVVGRYRPELVAAGATGCVDDIGQAKKFLS